MELPKYKGDGRPKKEGDGLGSTREKECLRRREMDMEVQGRRKA